MRSTRVPLLALALLGAAPAVAGGFQVNLAAQKNIGMAHVGTGLALDQGSIFFNPGALTFVRDRGVVVGASAVMSRSAFRSQDGTDFSFKNPVVTPFSIYAGFGPSAEGDTPAKWRAGIGVYTPFGATLDYGNQWTGRYSLTKISLLSGFIQPTVSYQVTPWLGLGAGFVIGLGYVNLEKDIPLTTSHADPAHIKLETESPATGYGFNAGIYLKPLEKVSIGISYRSQVDMKVKGGKVSVTNLPDNAAPVKAQFAGDKFDATLPLPATLSVGVGVMPTDKLTLAFDANFVQWSAYKSLDFTFNDAVGGSTTSSSIRNYQNAYTLRLGGQYKVADALTLRAGTYFDKTPVRAGHITPETPDADRWAGTAGASIHVSEHFDVDLSYEFLAFKQRSQTQDELIANQTTDRVAGTYKTYLNIAGLGINYKF